MMESIDTALVRIRTADGVVVGAGFFLGERFLLTCAHVVAQALALPDDPFEPPQSPVHLDFPQLPMHQLLTARVIFWRPVQSANMGDIAVLELLDLMPQGAKASHLVPTDQFTDHVWGDPFRAMGFPHGYDDGIWATGRLLGKQANGWVQLEDIKIPGFSVMSGFSGTPVWDEKLQGVVGMVVAASQGTTTKTAFAIPSDALLSAWPQLDTLMRPPVPHNPYKGLEVFEEADARYFFGRDALIEELRKAVETSLMLEREEGRAARLLAIIGPSGSGKSSVARAGLFPSLRKGDIIHSEEWIYLDPIVPGTHPLENLSVSFAKKLGRDTLLLHEQLQSSARTLHLIASDLISSPHQKVVLLIDQFEDLFTLTASEQERQAIFDLLITAVTEPQGPLFVILTLRADFYDRPMHYPVLFRLLDEHHVPVLPLEMQDLRRVIEQPVNLPEVQLVFEKGLVDELVVAMQGQSGALPLLEFTLDQLVRRRNGYQLTFQAYRQIGGITGALSQHAEETYQGLPTNDHRQMARAIFLRLIQPGVTEQDSTRRRAARSEFDQDEPTQEQRIQETLDRFIRARLLTANQVDGTMTVEVSHEALIREWKRLAEWLYEARSDIRLQESLSEDTREWEQRKHPGDRLYRGTQLKEAQAWARRNRPSTSEAAFLQASARRRLFWLASVVAFVLVLASSMGITSWSVFFQPNPTLVTSLQDNVVGSLRWCVDHASSQKTTIRFAPGLKGVIELTEGDLLFPGGKSFTLIGPGANQLAISGGNFNAKMHIAQGATLTISGLSFINSQTVIDAFLFNEGTLTISNSVISHNQTSAGAIAYGGGIENRGTLTAIDSHIVNNIARGTSKGQGGGIFNEGKLTVMRTVFSDNSAISSSGYGLGGAIDSSSSGNVTVIGSTFSMNTATGDTSGYGGSIDSEGKLMVTDSTFLHNLVSSTSSDGLSDGYGGGIYNGSTGTVTITGSLFSQNSASAPSTAEGGGIYNAGKTTLNQSSLLNNTASGDGYRNIFLKGIAGGDASGGGIYNGFEPANLTVTNSTISNNVADGHQGGDGSGGGIYNDATLTVINTTFWHNEASYAGGGILSLDNKSDSAMISFCTLYANTAEKGGGIWATSFLDNGDVTISSSIVADNSARRGPDIFGTLISNGYNMVENFAGSVGLNPRTDQQVTFANLGVQPTLGNNGGPTQTLAPLPGSPAIDAVPGPLCSVIITTVSGQSMTITTDQRGAPRPDGSENTCDIGAYESSY